MLNNAILAHLVLNFYHTTKKIFFDATGKIIALYSIHYSTGIFSVVEGDFGGLYPAISQIDAIITRTCYKSGYLRVLRFVIGS